LVTKDDALRAKQEHIDLMKQREWGIDADRLKKEQAVMAKKFPRFQLRQATEAITQHDWHVASQGQLYWLGKLRTHSSRIYTIVLPYPDNYPYDQIPCFVIDPFIPQTEHRYSDGHLCLYSNDHGGRGQGWDPTSTTAVSYVAWTAAWLHAHEIWAKTHRWPVLAVFQ
jgi:ubiquitin-protein ligase